MEAVEATATAEVMPPAAPWEALPEGQYAIVELMGHTTLAGPTMFHLTRAGAEAALLPGDVLNSEDWP